MDLPERKPTRLKDYDYSSNGAYFITICTYNKQKLLCDIVGDGAFDVPKTNLSSVGKIVEKYILSSNKIPNVTVDKYVIMPNHIHLIVNINNSGGHGNPPLQNIIGQLKSYTTNKFGNILWQRSYHDHIIRGEKDYQKIWEYIDTNVIRWDKDCFYMEE